MPETGWTGEGPDGGAALPVTQLLLAQHERAPGDTLAKALARGRAEVSREEREAAAEAPDPDECAASFVARGYMPGQLHELHQRLADTVAELEAEQAKIERHARRAEIVMREHQAGRIDAFGVQRALDGDAGDENRAARLQRRAEGLRWQIGEASALISPEQRAPDEFAQANRTAQTAHELFREVTRERMAAAQAGKPQRVRRPKELSRSRGGEVRRSELECVYCVQNNVSHEDSTLLHLDPAYAVPITSAAEAEQAERPVQAERRQDRAEVVERWPVTYGTHGLAVR